MATSAERAKSSLLNLNLSPSTDSDIEFPKIIKLVVVIVLATEQVELVVVDGGAERSTALRGSLFGGGGLEHLSTDSLCVSHGELCELIDARSVDETAENEE